MVSLSSGDYQMSKRQIENMLQDFFGVELALGTVVNLEQATSEAIAAPVAEVAKAIQNIRSHGGGTDGVDSTPSRTVNAYKIDKESALFGMQPSERRVRGLQRRRCQRDAR